MADHNSGGMVLDNNQKLENAIRAVSEKKPPPEIDFTLHTMEDGTQVSTLERVCKGMSLSYVLVLVDEPSRDLPREIHVSILLSFGGSL